jgi:hypothetical protein
VDAWTETEEEMTNKALVPVDNRLTKHADRIRGLMVDIAKNGLELGDELEQAYKHFKSLPKRRRPTTAWRMWVSEQFGLSEGWTRVLRKAARNAKGGPAYLQRTSPAVVALITSQPSSAGVEEIKHRLKKGQKVSLRKASRILRRPKGKTPAQLPSPTKAKEIAAEHGTIVIASDGRLYTSASEEAVKAVELQRNLVYGVRYAIEMIANISKTPREFLDFAAPHQLWKKEEESEINKAAEWLNGLMIEWQKKIMEAA